MSVLNSSCLFFSACFCQLPEREALGIAGLITFTPSLPETRPRKPVPRGRRAGRGWRCRQEHRWEALWDRPAWQSPALALVRARLKLSPGARQPAGAAMQDLWRFSIGPPVLPPACLYEVWINATSCSICLMKNQVLWFPLWFYVQNKWSKKGQTIFVYIYIYINLFFFLFLCF